VRTNQLFDFSVGEHDFSVGEHDFSVAEHDFSVELHYKRKHISLQTFIIYTLTIYINPSINIQPHSLHR
jgi:hypothetical protein